MAPAALVAGKAAAGKVVVMAALAVTVVKTEGKLEGQEAAATP